MSTTKQSEPVSIKKTVQVVMFGCLLLTAACGSVAMNDDVSGTDSSSHWLSQCSANEDCHDGLACLCGACTVSCQNNSECQTLDEAASCTTLSSCDAPKSCIVECTSDDECSVAGSSCVDEHCVVHRSLTAGGGGRGAAQPDASRGVSPSDIASSKDVVDGGGLVSADFDGVEPVGDTSEPVSERDAGREPEPAESEPAEPEPELARPPLDALTHEAVVELITSDKAELSEGKRQFTRYSSMHMLDASRWNMARAALSKALNATAPFSSAVVNPSCVDAQCVVHRFDVRDYWSAALPSGDGNEALAAWERIVAGNIELDRSDFVGAEAEFFPNILGFHAGYVEVPQLVYSLSRPDVYMALLQTPFLGDDLERSLGVDIASGINAHEFTLSLDTPVLFGERLIWRGEADAGYYYKATDPFSMVTDFSFFRYPVPEFTGDSFSQMITTPYDGTSNLVDEDTRAQGFQALASNVIYALPNGLQAFAVFGSASQRRPDVFTFIMNDTARNPDYVPGQPTTETGVGEGASGVGGPNRVIVGESCFRCHEAGLVPAFDAMRPYLDEKGAELDPEIVAQSYDIFPEAEARTERFARDNVSYQLAIETINDAMIDGAQLEGEPISTVSDWALELYGYIRSVSN